jgi:DNA mismatch endonuclease (patch repair protein)
MDNLTFEQRRKNMRAVRSRGTKIEIKLAKALWAEGLRYRKNCRDILGKPDIVFRKYKTAVFCDSEFWHGKNLTENKFKIKTNKKYWNKKIKSNIKRDKFVNENLKKDGWKVMRFWGKDIEKNIDKCTAEIKSYLKLNKP